MPRADKTIKNNKALRWKIGKAEKEAFEAISNAPKFPKKLTSIRKQHKTNC